MASSKPQDPRAKKYQEPKSIYYHCNSLKKLIDGENDSQLLQSLMTSLKEQNLMKPPFGKYYNCGDTSHWIADCPQKDEPLPLSDFESEMPSTSTESKRKQQPTEDSELTSKKKKSKIDWKKTRGGLRKKQSKKIKSEDYLDSEDDDNIQRGHGRSRAMIIDSDSEEVKQ